MSENSKIQWTHHTFNPWWGCVEVSPACDHCYARAFAHRLGHGVWGKDAPRRFFGGKHWNEPLKWNRDAEAAGEQRRVFCASMADVFEDREDLKPNRERLWHLVAKTPWLDWLLLTKRPGNIARFVTPFLCDQPNVWMGTTVEDRRHGVPRIEALRRSGPWPVLFLSIEPLIEDLGDVDLSGIDWAIVGGESGGGARPFDLAWARKLIAQSRAVGAAPFIKQLGTRPIDTGQPVRLRDHKGGDISEFPPDLRVREFPAAEGWRE